MLDRCPNGSPVPVRRLVPRALGAVLHRTKERLQAAYRAKRVIEHLHAQPTLVVLSYHCLARTAADIPNYIALGNRTSPHVFEAGLRWLAARFPFIGLHEGIRHWRSGRLAATHIALAFDDAMRSIETEALPILRRLNVPATVFANASALDDGDISWVSKVAYLAQTGHDGLLRETFARPTPAEGWTRYLRQHCSRADLPRIERLDAAFRKIHGPLSGIHLTWKFLESTAAQDRLEIGNHGLSHTRFSAMTRSDQRASVLENARRLERLPNYVPLFATPFGRPDDWNADTLAVAREVGHELVTLDGGLNRAGRLTPYVDRVSGEVGSRAGLQVRLWRAIAEDRTRSHSSLANTDREPRDFA